jgi:fructose-1,6-bisphosphatase II
MVTFMSSDDPQIEYAFLRATEAAAVAAGHLVGRGDKNGIDGAAVSAMRAVLRNIEFAGTVVIGEGEKDMAPMLFIGESLGTGEGARMDVAVDPIDGTTLASKGGPGAIAVVAGARRHALFGTHVHYMEKIVVGSAARGVVSLGRSVGENVRAVARAMAREVTEITVAVQDRPRNQYVIDGVRELGARVRVFTDGDVAMGVMAVMDEHRIDMLMGIGGAPEGVITACAARALGGDMQGRLWQDGVTDDRILTLGDLCSSNETFFAATGVTTGELLEGVTYVRGYAHTQSIVISSYTGCARRLTSRHVVDRAHAALQAPFDLVSFAAV